GEHYWDGGFMGNPAIFPLIYNRGSKDVILVHINPIERKKLPKTAAEIFNRVDEISFNSSLMREMRAVAFVTKLIDDTQRTPTPSARLPPSPAAPAAARSSWWPREDRRGQALELFPTPSPCGAAA